MYTLQVEKMSGGHCVKAVTSAVQTIDPQATVQVDLAQETVKVESAVPVDRIAAAIVDAGYPVPAAEAG